MAVVGEKNVLIPFGPDWVRGKDAISPHPLPWEVGSRTPQGHKQNGKQGTTEIMVPKPAIPGEGGAMEKNVKNKMAYAWATHMKFDSGSGTVSI